jgi:hypothetical protein
VPDAGFACEIQAWKFKQCPVASRVAMLNLLIDFGVATPVKMVEAYCQE